MNRRTIFKYKRLRRGLLALLTTVLALATPAMVFAHPLGNFTINRYSRLELGPDQIRVRYVIDMAEIPTFQEKAKIDLNHDDALSDAEKDQYLQHQVADLQSNLHLTVNGDAIPLQPQDAQLDFLPGQGGLQTTRIALWFIARTTVSNLSQADYRDDNFAGRLGWQEIVVRSAPGVDLLVSTAPDRDISSELRSYPQDMLQNPPAISSAAFRFAPTGAGQASGVPAIQSTYAQSSQSLQGRSNDPFAELIAIPDLGLGAITLALAGAFVWGALHAFSPGHGKTIVAAYLVGSRATARHALFLGLTTTITHTTGVFTLGLITLLASRYIVPEQLYPWLETASGLLLIIMGLALFMGRLRRAPAHVYDHSHTHTSDHDHGHRGEHRHEHGHDHHGADDHSHTHSHLPPGAGSTRVTWRSLLALGISGGLLPCPSALVVMLGAIALNRLVFGLVLIIIFSTGLASALTVLGIVMVHAKTLLVRFNHDGRLFGRFALNSGVIRILPAISALFIVVAGIGITLAALTQAGMIRL